MEVLVALGKIYGAEELIPITSAHLSGVSYKTIGNGGLEFLIEMSAEGRVVVPTTINPAGMDRERWREMGIDPEFAAKQIEILESYGRMGVELCCTCTPYLGENVPQRGDHVAWAESSALSFVNSVIGARTNREGGPGALAAAIVGKTPAYGLHLEENRAPDVIIEASIDDDLLSHSLLGHAVGKRFGGVVPYFRGINPDTDCIKTMAAAMAAAGSVAMFHVEGVTPEHAEHDLSSLERVSIDRKEIHEARESLTTGGTPELIALGCPHLSERELRDIGKMLNGRERRGDIEVWFCTSRRVRNRCPNEVAILERFGKVLCDTCMVVAPIESRFSVTGTNSGKACNYLPGLCSQRVLCAPTEELLEMIT